MTRRYEFYVLATRTLKFVSSSHHVIASICSSRNEFYLICCISINRVTCQGTVPYASLPNHTITLCMKQCYLHKLSCALLIFSLSFFSFLFLLFQIQTIVLRLSKYKSKFLTCIFGQKNNRSTEIKFSIILLQMECYCKVGIYSE